MNSFGQNRQQSARPGALDGYLGGFRRGFLTTMVLWPGVMPFGIAFAIVAHAAGFSLVETQALSLLVFAGASQLITVTLAMSGVATIPIVLTAFLLNLRHLLYGLSLSRWLSSATRPPRGILAFFLTDESYGLTIRALLENYGNDAFLFGSEVSLFSSWNVATLAGSLLGARLPNPYHIGLDFIFPLVFLALLVPLLRSFQYVVVALTSVAVAAVAGHFAAGGVAVLAAGVCAAGLGTFLDHTRPAHNSSENEPADEREVSL
jgi:4-azaleucine resistance transporter AzlC